MERGRYSRQTEEGLSGYDMDRWNHAPEKDKSQTDSMVQWILRHKEGCATSNKGSDVRRWVVRGRSCLTQQGNVVVLAQPSTSYHWQTETMMSKTEFVRCFMCLSPCRRYPSWETAASVKYPMISQNNLEEEACGTCPPKLLRRTRSNEDSI